jgi:hypothetical protein
MPAIEIGPDQLRVRLKAEVAKPEYVDPAGVETFCNYFVREVAHWFGYNGFDDTPDRKYSAADFYRILERERNCPSDWLPLVSFQDACSFANHGRLVVAAAPPVGDIKHGHVAIVAPEPCQWSPSWDDGLCAVANVGNDNWYGKRLSWAFKLAQREKLGLYLFVREAPRTPA